jgi:hypothetical protein
VNAAAAAPPRGAETFRDLALGGAPTGSRDLSVLSVGTGRVTRFELPEGINARPPAWSPDGHLLAMIQSDQVPDGHGGQNRHPQALKFYSVDARPGFVPGDIVLDPSASFVGWLGDSVVIWGGARPSAVPIGGGPARTLAETGAEVSSVQIATGLLPTARFVEPGAVDRGPWPHRARLAVAIPPGC